MLNINSIISNPEEIQSKLSKRGYTLDVDGLISVYNERKDLIKVKENIAAEKNKLNDKFRNATSDQEKDRIKEKSQEYEKEISKNKTLLEDKESQLNQLLLNIPNIPSDDIPSGDSELENKVIKTWGKPTKNNHEHSGLFLKNSLILISDCLISFTL